MVAPWLHHPSHKVPILDWWAGHFDTVFVALNPFYRLRRVAPRDGCRYEPLIEPRNNAVHDAAKTRGEPVSWAHVHQVVAPEVPWDLFCRAVWLLSAAGFQERAGIALQRRLADWCAAERLYLPDSDFLPAIQQPPIGRFFARFGDPSIVAWDEHRWVSVALPLTALARRGPTFLMPEGAQWREMSAVHLADPGVLMTTDFDDSAALIAMTRAAHDLARPEDFFEGWYAGPDTYADVFNPVDAFERDPRPDTPPQGRRASTK